MNRFAIALIIIYPTLFLWQGLDFTDTGFVLANYQQMFNDPSSVETSYRLWLSNVLGGLWLYFFGDSWGLIGYRFAATLLVWGTLFGSYLTLREYIPKKYLLWGLLLALVFINRSDFQLNYNSFTAFFFVYSAYYLDRGLKEENNGFVFIAALILGLNIFIRLPNILGFLLIICIFLFGQPKQLRHFIAGYTSAVVGALLLMYFLGHLEAYTDSLLGAFSMLADQNNHHSSEKLGNIFVYQHWQVLKNLSFVVLGALLLGGVLSLTGRFRKGSLQFLIITLFTLALIFLFIDSFENRFRSLITILGILYLFLVLMLRQVSQIALIALLILIIAPLGSNNGVYNSVYGMYLALPLVFSFVLEIRDLSFSHWRINETELRLIKVLAVSLLVIFTLKSTYNFTYRETSHREQLVNQVDNPKLRGIFTTKERALVVEELLNVLPQYVQKDDYLLAYEQIPMVHFLTGTRPYLYGSWPMLYRVDQFENLLARAQKERTYLPVIVRAKGSTERITWPRTVKLTETDTQQKIREKMNIFISEKNYKLVWENSFFQILIPGKGGR